MTDILRDSGTAGNLALVSPPKRLMAEPLDVAPPHNVEAEQSILGAVVLRGELFPEVAKLVQSSDFYRLAHGKIFRRMQELHTKGSAIDFLTLKDALARAGELEDIGGAVYLSSLTDGLPHATNSQHYGRIVKEAATARQWFYTLTRARGAIATDPASVPIVAAEVQQLISTAGGLQPSGGLMLLTESDILSRPMPRMLIAGRIVAGSLFALVGAPGVGKTFAATDLAFSVTTGRRWLGAPVDAAGTAILVAAEGAAGMRLRVHAWRAAHGITDDTGLHVWPSAVNLMDPVDVGYFLAKADAVRPALVIIDTLARCMLGGDENSSRDMGLAIAQADRIRQVTGAAVGLIHHTTKTSDVERGSGALRGALDTLLTLRKADDLLTLGCDKQKDLSPFDEVRVVLVPTLQGESCVLRLTSEVCDPDTLTPLQLRALRALVDSFGDRSVTRPEWRAVCPGAVEASFYRAVRNLSEYGYVTESAARSSTFQVTDKGRLAARAGANS